MKSVASSSNHPPRSYSCNSVNGGPRDCGLSFVSSDAGRSIMKQQVASLKPDVPASKPVEHPCPRCGEALTDAAGLGWCQGCGYCRSLDEDPAKDYLPAPAPAAPAAVAEASQVVTRTPLWVWVMALGLVTLAAASWRVGLWLPPNSHQRALWTTLQIASGVFTMFVAQFFALFKLAPYDETLSFKDVFLPGRLWSHALKRMPGYGGHFCVAVWGLTLVVCAFLFIGGLNYWYTYLPGKHNSTHNIHR